MECGRRWQLAAAFAVSYAVVLAAQGSSRIVGQVKDPSGTGLPGVELTLNSVPFLADARRTSVSNGEGRYEFANVEPGRRYTVRAELLVFESVESPPFTVGAADVVKVDLAMRLGCIGYDLIVEDPLTDDVRRADAVVDVTIIASSDRENWYFPTGCAPVRQHVANVLRTARIPAASRSRQLPLLNFVGEYDPDPEAGHEYLMLLRWHKEWRLFEVVRFFSVTNGRLSWRPDSGIPHMRDEMSVAEAMLRLRQFLARRPR